MAPPTSTDFSDAQAILGPLARGTSLVYKYDEIKKRFQVAYLNSYAEAISTEYPRLELLPLGWSVKHYTEENSHGVYGLGPGFHGSNEESKGKATSRDPRLTPEALRERCVELQHFQLV